MGWALLFFRVRWLKTRHGSDRGAAQGWLDAYRFWTKVFALTFALGVVSGITMSFQFGTNWPGFMQKVGNIAGPLLGYEVLTAFFLEAGFLGVMLFGHGKVSERVHLMATCFVAFGTTLSAFWILALNSWMQTPAGYEIVDGDLHGLNTLEHQPAKIAAVEGVWHTEHGAPLLLFALPHLEARENRFEVKVPKLPSLILTHDLEGEIKGLDEFRGRHPPP